MPVSVGMSLIWSIMALEDLFESCVAHFVHPRKIHTPKYLEKPLGKWEWEGCCYDMNRH